MSLSTHPGLSAVFSVLTLIGADQATAMSDAECDKVHLLIDETFQNFSSLLGPVIGRDPTGDVTAFAVSKRADPFDYCRILDWSEPKPGRILECDLGRQAEIEAINGKQSEFALKGFLKLIDSVANDYSKCFFSTPVYSGKSTTTGDRTSVDWLWSLNLWAMPQHLAIVTLKAETGAIGYEIGKPSVKVSFARVERKSSSPNK